MSSRRFAPVLVVAGAVLPSVAAAQAVVDVRPSLTITELYDSNLFASSIAPRADLITRVTPSLESGYRTPTLDLRAEYTLDADRYAEDEQLSRLDARQQARLELRYLATPRTTWRANAGVTRTWMPGELLLQSGLLLPRGLATRVSAQSAVTRHLDQRTEGTAEYTFTDDRIHDGVTVRSHVAAFNAVRRLSPRTSARLEYRLESYGFGLQRLETPASVTAHAIGMGWTAALTDRTSLSLTGGPRVTGGRLAPDLSASVHSRRHRGAMAFSYQRTQAVVIGVPRPVAIQSVSAQAVWGRSEGPRVRFTPGLFRNRAGRFHADVYRVELGLEWPIAKTLAIDVAVDSTTQSGQLSAAVPAGDLARHTSTVRLIVRPPATHQR